MRHLRRWELDAFQKENRGSWEHAPSYTTPSTVLIDGLGESLDGQSSNSWNIHAEKYDFATSLMFLASTVDEL